MTLTPKETACLMLKAGEATVGYVRVTLHEVSLQCRKSSLFFTRDHDVKVHSQHLCATVGSCYPDRCAKILAEETIPEFDGKSNLLPGTTHCQEHCGCWWCGCWHCGSSCIFHRHFASPTHDEDIYEVFRCLAWEPRAVVRVEIQRANIVEDQRFVLLPNLAEIRPDFQINVDIPTMPPMPILSHPFIASNISAAIIDEMDLPKLRQLSCDSEEDAKEFRCNLNSDTCECGFYDELDCKCQKSSVEKMFDSHEGLLPMNTPTMTIYEEKRQISAHFHQQISAKISLHLQNFNVATLIQKTQCTIEIRSINGCYDCKTAAEIKYVCKSSNAIIGHARCLHTHFIVQCGSDDEEKTTHANFDYQNINQNCNLTCTTEITKFHVNATLNYVSYHVEAKYKNARTTWLAGSRENGVSLDTLLFAFGGASV